MISKGTLLNMVILAQRRNCNHLTQGPRQYHLRYWSILLVIVILCVCSGCETQREDVETSPAPKTASQTHRLLTDAIQPVLTEVVPQALTVWRKFKPQQPTLVLFANNPYLKPTPKSQREEITRAFEKEGGGDLRPRLNPARPDPLILPDMALTVALQLGLFSRIVWVLPHDSSFGNQSPLSFRNHMVNYGAVNQDDTVKFIKDNGGFSGDIKGVPFQAVPYSALPAITGPVILHIDLPYFGPIYLDEVRTPLYPLLREQLLGIKSAGWATQTVTISFSNIGGGLPLDSRFLGPALSEIFQDPELLDQEPPINWLRRAKALYLESFFQMETIELLYQQMAEEAPDDPSVQYGLYKTYRQGKDPAKALENLDQAVHLDRVYGLEYLDLAALAQQNDNHLMRMDMLRKAQQALPDDAFIALKRVETYLSFQNKRKALPLIDELDRLPWSKVYYPGVPSQLRAWRQQIESSPEQQSTGH
jgi:hypothetical protein